jgi:hypothetical protein
VRCCDCAHFVTDTGDGLGAGRCSTDGEGSRHTPRWQVSPLLWARAERRCGDWATIEQPHANTQCHAGVLPVRFTGDLVEQVDGRSMLGRAVRDRLERLYRDLGGDDAGGAYRSNSNPWPRTRFGLICFYRTRNAGVLKARVSTSILT